MNSTTIPLSELLSWLDRLAPHALAEAWDNVGLLVGDPNAAIARVLTCLTLSSDVVEEAIREQVDLVISHHPLPFRPLAKITTKSSTGARLLKLFAHQCAVCSYHTAYDSCLDGINDQWCQRLGILDPRPLRENAAFAGAGGGRHGAIAPIRLVDLAAKVKLSVAATSVDYVGGADLIVSRAAVACGSGGEFLEDAARLDCQALITGETNLHTCLDALEKGMGIVLVGHFHSERFAMEELARRLAAAFPAIAVWASREERNPLKNL